MKIKSRMIAIAVVVGAFSALVGPTAAAQACPAQYPGAPVVSGCGEAQVYATANPGFVGWANVAHPKGDFVGFLQDNVNAYYLYGHQFKGWKLPVGDDVYVEPYAQGWDWAYSETYRYWFVVSTNRILIQGGGIYS